MKVWEALQSMKENGPGDNYYGICSNLDFNDMSISAYDTWNDNHKACFKAWVEYSGDSWYPIPGYDNYTPAEAFDETGRYQMWDRTHEYGTARWRLLDHCINWFKEFETTPH